MNVEIFDFNALEPIKVHKGLLPLPYHFVKVIDRESISMFDRYFSVKHLQKKSIKKKSFYKPISKMLSNGY